MECPLERVLADSRQANRNKQGKKQADFAELHFGFFPYSQVFAPASPVPIRGYYERETVRTRLRPTVILSPQGNESKNYLACLRNQRRNRMLLRPGRCFKNPAIENGSEVLARIQALLFLIKLFSKTAMKQRGHHVDPTSEAAH